MHVCATAEISISIDPDAEVAAETTLVGCRHIHVPHVESSAIFQLGLIRSTLLRVRKIAEIIHQVEGERLNRTRQECHNGNTSSRISVANV